MHIKKGKEKHGRADPVYIHPSPLGTGVRDVHDNLSFLLVSFVPLPRKAHKLRNARREKSLNALYLSKESIALDLTLRETKTYVRHDSPPDTRKKEITRCSRHRAI